MATLTVGTGQQYSTIASAVAAARDGDIVQVQAGTYVNDFAVINSKITLQGVGGMVKMVATGRIPNDKGILITNTDATIDHFDFSGATGASGNAAGIRYQGGDLTITNSYFHHNQNGLLANPSTTGTITVRNSEFAFNGVGDGYTHNLYVGKIAKLTVDDSYFHDASVGHQIKSRALETVITDTRIYDMNGTSSYSVDLPNGGKATLSGNTIEQGPNGGNPVIVAFGAEGGLYAGSSINMSENTVVNDMGRGPMLMNVGGSPASIDGLKVFGLSSSQLFSGSGVKVDNVSYLSNEPALDTSQPWTGATTSPTQPAPTPEPTPGFQTTLIGDSLDNELIGGAGRNYIRGGEGRDLLVGGDQFDDLHGNIGDDTLRGEGGSDWVVGGQGSDWLMGGDGDDLVIGNLAADTLEGGAGTDTLRGGQDHDILHGGDGDDWISGDRGDDTIHGGAGADRFHIFDGANHDYVVDFNQAEGDQVALAAGATYGVAQVGNDVVVSVGDARMVLLGVDISTLAPGWIVTL